MYARVFNAYICRNEFKKYISSSSEWLSKNSQFEDQLLSRSNFITKTCLFIYIENFTTKKKGKNSYKNSDIFQISAQNIDWGYALEPPRRGGSNEYPQSMVLSRNKKNNVYLCKPQFYYIKVGLEGVNII